MLSRMLFTASRGFMLLSALLVSACGGGSSGGSSEPQSNNNDQSTTQPTNQAPQLALAISDVSIAVGEALALDVSQNGQTFTDADGDALTYSISISPNGSGFTFSDVNLTGNAQTAGDYSVEVTATDTGNLSASASFGIEIYTPDEPEPEPEPEPQTKKNILLIIADDMGQDSSAQYDVGTDLPVTPNLNTLANEGIIFDNVWVNPSCSPTRASMISGKYGVHTGVLSPGDELDDEEVTVHESIKAHADTSDYATAIVGKWHIGDSTTAPANNGVDHFVGLKAGGVSDYYSWEMITNGVESDETTYVTTEFTDQAISWVEQQDSPWFLWLAYNAPHTPFHLPPNDLHDRTLSGDEADIEANERDYYLAAIEALDTEIGRFLDSMDDETRENTIILFIGDNGTPGRASERGIDLNGSKSSIYEGGVKVPMVISGAGVTREGVREDALINGTDFFSTILELAGQEVIPVHDSQSFAALLTDENASSRDFIFTQGDEGTAIRSQQYKLIELTDGSRGLYDLENDPSESSNLINTTDGIETELHALTTQLSMINNDSWIVNTSDERSPYLMDGGSFVEVNVLSTVSSGDSVIVTTNAIPNYKVEITSEALAVYQSRQDSAFSAGRILSVGDHVDFGEDVGMTANCGTTGGDGWWPQSGSACPESENGLELSFPADPEPFMGECETGLGPVGLWVNGVPIYNWSDASSYNDEDIWDNFAEPFRSAAMDMCNGHAGNGMYHHHSYNVCLRQQLNDEGERHSPIYGYAGDGYPIHGPYHADGLLTKSCWKKRDYSASSETGCGVEGARTCTFVDEEDISRGTQTVSAGPSTDETISFFTAGNSVAESGIFYQDYYYDASCPAQGEEYLDEHSGHDHDGLGYHYHTSVDENLEPVFPLVNGPDYYGDVGNGSFECFRRNF